MLRATWVFGLTVSVCMLVSAAANGQQNNQNYQNNQNNQTMDQSPTVWDHIKHVFGDDTPSQPAAPDNSPPHKADPFGGDRKFRRATGTTNSSDSPAYQNNGQNGNQNNNQSGGQNGNQYNNQNGNQPANAKPFNSQQNYNNQNQPQNGGQYQNNQNQNGYQNQNGNQNQSATQRPAQQQFNQNGNVQQRPANQNGYANGAGNSQAAPAANNSARRNSPSVGGEAVVSDMPAGPAPRGPQYAKPTDTSDAYASDDGASPKQPSPNNAQRSLQERLNAAQRANQGQPVTTVKPGQGPSAGPLPQETRVAQQPTKGGAVSVSDQPTVRATDKVVDIDSTPRAPGEVKSSRRNGAKPMASPIATGVTEAPTVLESTKPEQELPKTAPSVEAYSAKAPTPILGAETAGPRTIVAGKEAVYIITLRNDGDLAAADVLVNIKIPEWTELMGSQATSGNTRPAAPSSGEPFQWRIAKLDAHGHEQVTLKLIPRKAKPFDLTAQWTFSQASAQSLVEVQEPKIQMTLTGPADVLYGESKVYKLSITNPGSGDAENVTLTLPPVGDSQEGPVTHNMGLVKAGETKAVEIELTARQVGNLVLRASATADGGLSTTATEEVFVRRASLQVDIEAPKAKLAGTSAVYTIKVSNPGTAPADNVQITAILPKQAKFLAAGNGGQFVADQGKVVWSLPNIRPGANAEFDIKCQLIGAGQNRLQVTANAGTDITEVAAANTLVEAVADLKLDVVDPAGPISVGDDVTYEVHLRNRGSKTAENVDITAFFSNGVRPVAAQGAPYTLFDNDDGQIIFEPVTSLAAGHELVLKVKAKVERAGKHIFRTEVKCEALDVNLATSETMLCYGEDGSGYKAEPRPTTQRGIEGKVNDEQPLVKKGPARLPSSGPMPLQSDLMPREAGRDGGLMPRR